MSLSPMGNYGASGRGMGQASGSNVGGNVVPKGYKMGQIQKFTPEAMQLYQRLFSQLSPDSYLYKLLGGDEGAFEEMETPAWRHFQESLGQLGSRYSGMGMGAQRGSGFKLEGTQAASEFAQDLAARRHELRSQALRDLMNMSQQLLGQSPYEQFLIEKEQKPSKFAQAMGIGLPILGAVGGALIPGLGPMGAAAGGALGNVAASAFTKKPAPAIDYAGISQLPRSWRA